MSMTTKAEARKDYGADFPPLQTQNSGGKRKNQTEKKVSTQRDKIDTPRSSKRGGLRPSTRSQTQKGQNTSEENLAKEKVVKETVAKTASLPETSDPQSSSSRLERRLQDLCRQCLGESDQVDCETLTDEQLLKLVAQQIEKEVESSESAEQEKVMETLRKENEELKARVTELQKSNESLKATATKTEESTAQMSELQKKLSQTEKALKDKQKESSEAEKRNREIKVLLLDQRNELRNIFPDSDYPEKNPDQELIAQAAKSIFDINQDMCGRFGIEKQPSVSESNRKQPESRDVQLQSQVQQFQTQLNELTKNIETEIKKLNANNGNIKSTLDRLIKLTINLNQIYAKASDLCREIKKKLPGLQEEINKNEVMQLSERTKSDVATIQRWNSVSKLDRDFKKHKEVLENKSDVLVDIVTRYYELRHSFSLTIHKVKRELDANKVTDIPVNLLELSSAVHRMPIGIEFITIPSLQEYLILQLSKETLSQLETFVADSVRYRRIVQKKGLPNSEVEKQKHLVSLEMNYQKQKAEFIELYRSWASLKSYVEKFEGELKEKVLNGRSIEPMTELEKQKVAKIEGSTIEQIQDRINDFNSGLQACENTLATIDKTKIEINDYIKEAKFETQRGYDATQSTYTHSAGVYASRTKAETSSWIGGGLCVDEDLVDSIKKIDESYKKQSSHLQEQDS